MGIVCLTPSTWKVRNGEARSAVVLSSAYPVHESASELNRLGAKVQVVSCRRYLVFHISGLVLASTSVLRVLDLTMAIAHDCIMKRSLSYSWEGFYSHNNAPCDRLKKSCSGLVGPEARKPCWRRGRLRRLLLLLCETGLKGGELQLKPSSHSLFLVLSALPVHCYCVS